MELPEKLQPEHDSSVKMLEKFESIQDGHLGRINAVKHHINITSKDVSPIHSIPYRVRRAARKFSTVEIDVVLEKEFLKHSRAKWASSVFFAK